MNRTRTIAGPGISETVVKKSRFLCSLARVSSEDEAREFIAATKKTYWDANHNCSAWVIGERAESQRTSDDGEPSGTAGVPMLTVLNARELTDVVAVVTRYFGGTLLGAGGLIRAYGGAVTQAIDQVGIVDRIPLLIVRATADHDEAGRLDFALRGTDYLLADVDYGERVGFTLHLAEEDLPGFESWLSETTSGRCSAEVVGVEIVEVPVTV